MSIKKNTKIRFTQEGLENLQQEYDKLLKMRPSTVEDLRKAREMGDLKENGYYKASRSKLSFIDSRLAQYKMSLRNAVVSSVNKTDTIEIGRDVIIIDGADEKKFKIVGDLEANPSDGKISLLSPLGSALHGKKAGDTVIYSTRNGTKNLKIIKVL